MMLAMSVTMILTVKVIMMNVVQVFIKNNLREISVVNFLNFDFFKAFEDYQK